jgi:hypothetical protein
MPTSESGNSRTTTKMGAQRAQISEYLRGKYKSTSHSTSWVKQPKIEGRTVRMSFVQQM